MKYEMIKGYLQVILSGLVLLAGVVLAVLQWGNASAFSLYGQNRNVNTALLMVCSAAGGIVAVWMCKLLYRGAVALYKSRDLEDRPPG
jgi:hypothetical protein